MKTKPCSTSMLARRFRSPAYSKVWRLTARACLLFMAVVVHAQQYHVDWFSIDGGGGISSGEHYSVSGTVGQPDAGRLTGGDYALEGGFWGITAAIQTPGAPLLSIAHLNNTVIVSWPLPAAGFVLDQASALSSTGGNISWSQVPFPYQTNATHIFITLPSPGGHNFYRLRKP